MSRTCHGRVRWISLSVSLGCSRAALSQVRKRQRPALPRQRERETPRDAKVGRIEHVLHETCPAACHGSVQHARVELGGRDSLLPRAAPPHLLAPRLDERLKGPGKGVGGRRSPRLLSSPARRSGAPASRCRCTRRSRRRSRRLRAATVEVSRRTLGQRRPAAAPRADQLLEHVLERDDAYNI